MLHEKYFLYVYADSKISLKSAFIYKHPVNPVYDNFHDHSRLLTGINMCSNEQSYLH